jgi:hypothetical protein
VISARGLHVLGGEQQRVLHGDDLVASMVVIRSPSEREVVRTIFRARAQDLLDVGID